MRFEFGSKDANLAIEANLDELAALGKGVLELADNNISLTDIINMVTSGKVPDGFNPDKKEKSEEPEEATDEEELRDDYISRLRELGYKVIVEEESECDNLIECCTFCDKTSNMEKAKLVKAWLESNSISYKIGTTGIKKYIYHLTLTQLVELQKYLKDNDILSYDVVI